MSNIEEKKYPLDLSPEEVKQLNKFVDDGLPGIASVKEEKLKEAVELYFNGADYKEISNRTGIKKIAIFYFAHKFQWYDKKIEMYESLVRTLTEKAEIAHARSIDLITDLMGSLESYYRGIINNYRISKNPKIIESAEMENLKIYMKCMEQIQKFRNPTESKNPTMNLTLPNGGRLKKIDDNTIEVSTPSSQVAERAVSEVLAALASIKKEAEKKIE